MSAGIYTVRNTVQARAKAIYRNASRSSLICLNYVNKMVWDWDSINGKKKKKMHFQGLD